MTGSFYCVPSGKATVIYRVYNPPKLRYKYPDGDWQEITALNGGQLTYTREREPGQCCPREYYVNFSIKIVRCFDMATIVNTTRDALVPGKIRGFYLGLMPGRITGTHFYAQIENCDGSISYRSIYSRISNFVTTGCPNKNGSTSNIYLPACSFTINSIVPEDQGLDNCGDCVFQVFEDGQLIFQQKNPDCPQVENIPCSLSETEQQITTTKVPYLERFEVVDYGYGIIALPGGINIDYYDIPPECLNLYVSTITAPTKYGTPDNSAPNYHYVAQICSAPGCPPPQYQVICGDVEQCPEGTCEVDCGTVICCYGSDGKPVKTIPK